jgi:paraquat-inducible protein B
MKPMEMLNQIKSVLGVELSTEEKVELAQAKLENGTVLEAESFESGKEVFILTDDEKVALPIGQYEMEDGKILVIEEDGIISEIKEGGEEEVEEVIEEESSEVEEELSEEVYASKDEISELKAMIEDLKSQLQLKEEEKVEEIGLAVTTMLSEQEQLEEELSKPASEPIKHSPEAKQELNKVVYSQKRNLTTKDIVYNKIANFK